MSAKLGLRPPTRAVQAPITFLLRRRKIEDITSGDRKFGLLDKILLRGSKILEIYDNGMWRLKKGKIGRWEQLAFEISPKQAKYIVKKVLKSIDSFNENDGGWGKFAFVLGPHNEIEDISLEQQKFAKDAITSGKIRQSEEFLSKYWWSDCKEVLIHNDGAWWLKDGKVGLWKQKIYEISLLQIQAILKRTARIWRNFDAD